ncbi:hypothetical protein N657DRAFT_639173 [Parathielavia appendiculata]|uniref:Uncharacterized protein n=1 Tax=Parathielavia appendiculata TaxID=2587402 RepID=A0AAN6U940_9PEZI|nr:hypothetical protein N657DRAFT_639173 [Parathielavia appendiculata]
MDAVSTYSVASLSWLTIQAVPLIIWPSLISTLLRIDSASQSAHYGVTNASLEQYFARSLGLAQLAFAGLLLIQSGTLPLDSVVEGPEIPSSPTPTASAAVLVTAIYHAAAASYTYSRYHWTGQSAYLLGCLASSALAASGLWVLMFAGESKKRVSRRTGADKSTSSWPFRNAVADRKRR